MLDIYKLYNTYSDSKTFTFKDVGQKCFIPFYAGMQIYPIEVTIDDNLVEYYKGPAFKTHEECHKYTKAIADNEFYKHYGSNMKLKSLPIRD